MCSGLPLCTPSLKDLSHELLGIDMRTQGEAEGQGQAGQPHDSQEDAIMAMKLALYELKQQQPGTKPLPAPQIKVGDCVGVCLG